MSISTYSELSTAIAGWLDRADLTGLIPDFITLAEAQIARDVKCRAMVKRATASVSTQYADAPTDALEYINIQITSSGSIKRLQYMTPEQMDYAFDSASTGTPTHYTILGDEIQFAPVPDAAFTVEIAYYGRFVALATTLTNWLLANHPGIYLYGALMQAEPYIQNDQRALTWYTMYQREIDALNKQEQRASLAGPLMMRSDIADVTA